MAAEALPIALETSAAAPIDLSDPIGLAKLAVETGSVPLPIRLLLTLVKKSNDLVRRSDGTINRRLAEFMEYKVPASEVPDKRGVSSKDVVINTQTGVWVRVFRPPVADASTATSKQAAGNMDSMATHSQTDAASATKRRVIFHFHGGGFAVLSADAFNYDTFCRRLCKRSEAVVISVNYRRAPEHRYPTAYDDSYAALEWLEGFKGEIFAPHKLDLSQCVLMGDSAGANIVHHVGCRWLARKVAAMPSTSLPHQQLKVEAHVLLFPFFGGEERTQAELRLTASKAPLVSVENSDWHWRAFLPPEADRDHPACNVFGPNAPDLLPLPLPRTLVAIAEFDLLKDWQLRYAQGLAKLSKPVRLLYYASGVHCFHILTKNKLCSSILLDIISFIEGEQAREETPPCLVMDEETPPCLVMDAVIDKYAINGDQKKAVHGEEWKEPLLVEPGHSPCEFTPPLPQAAQGSPAPPSLLSERLKRGNPASLPEQGVKSDVVEKEGSIASKQEQDVQPYPIEQNRGSPTSQKGQQDIHRDVMEKKAGFRASKQEQGVHLDVIEEASSPASRKEHGVQQNAIEKKGGSAASKQKQLVQPDVHEKKGGFTASMQE